MTVSFQMRGSWRPSSSACASLQAFAERLGEGESGDAPQAVADRRYPQNIGRARCVAIERPEMHAAQGVFACEPGDDPCVLEGENVGHDVIDSYHRGQFYAAHRDAK